MSDEAELPFDPNQAPSRLAHVVTCYAQDSQTLARKYPTPFAHDRVEAFQAHTARWTCALETLDPRQLQYGDRADLLLLKTRIAGDASNLQREVRRFAQLENWLPFAAELFALESLRCREYVADARSSAAMLDSAAEIAESTVQRVTQSLDTCQSDNIPTVSLAASLVSAIESLKGMLDDWRSFFEPFDPAFDWWMDRPYRRLDAALDAYVALLRDRVLTTQGRKAIAGEPEGVAAIVDALQRDQIPYSPEELQAAAQREKAWCLEELRLASREMGCGDNWRAALERVKERHAAPGGQPALVRDLAREAVSFIEERNLVTIPHLARTGWRMEMLSAEAQLVSPFFLGGPLIMVSFPTKSMEHQNKLMSLRGNNRHFARATVQHELIPGHHLQSYYESRFHPWRRLFHTPFWTEGWTMHWEMLLWELGFAQSPEDRIGMLFWRLHRCVRVAFSLGFQLGELSTEQCVEMLVAEVGHERANAEAEVRRSFGGEYDILYQCAYLIGGLQVHALYREMTAEHGMTPLAFHDAFLKENCMPIATLRALMLGEPFGTSGPAEWRFLPD
ncbi:MAG: DUF885 family protein [Armatimonadetes bacterium]|nr:DUF885 family protein [Armatimonadota bacterium]MDE2206926.1 DUF885 family protein [Armatimonadota bacterium]